MGYIEVEKFSNLSEWKKISGDEPSSVLLREIDWTEYTFSGGKSLFFQFNLTEPDLTPVEYSKKYEKPIHFVFNTDTNPIYFTELSLSSKLPVRSGILPVVFKDRDDFFMTISIYAEGEFLREWHIPYASSARFSTNKFDLLPLIQEGKTYFNEIRFKVLKSPGVFNLFLGNIVVMQEDIEHNCLVSIQNLFHQKINHTIGSLTKSITQGDNKIQLVVSNQFEITHGYCLLIGSLEGIHETHVVYNPIPIGDNVWECDFINDFDGNKIVGAFGIGTTVSLLIPALSEDRSETFEVIPSFMIYVSEPDPTETENARTGLFNLDSYVRADIDLVANRKAGDSVKLICTIEVNAQDPAIAVEMYNLVTKIIDRQTNLLICNDIVEYEVIDYSKTHTGKNVLEVLPQYTVVLEITAINNVHERVYRPFPNIREVDLQGIEPGAINLISERINVQYSKSISK